MDRAFDLYEQALRTTNVQKSKGLLEEALTLDPTNLDIRLALLDCEELTEAAYIASLRELVSLGESMLGKSRFKAKPPHFWLDVDTRPYMTVRYQLAEVLFENELFLEASKEYSAMLKLNETDNQGCRYPLALCYIALGRPNDLQNLFDKYPADLTQNCVFAYAYALNRLLCGDHYGFVLGMQAARGQNPYVEKFLTGKRSFPEHLPDGYAPGSLQEAEVFGEMIILALAQYPELWTILVDYLTRAMEPRKKK